MVQEIVHSYDTSEAMAASQADLRSLMQQVEAELHHSPVYGRVLANLQTLPTELGQQLQRMVNAIGREAIRLSFRQRARQNSKAEARPGEGFAVSPSSAPHPKLESIESGSKSSESESSGSVAPVASVPPIAPANRPVQQRRRVSKRELAAQAARQAWEERLRQVGAEIRQVRQAAAQTPYQLHLKTQVPLHQIEALESGQIARLPEDIYVRGFLRRLGCALNLDGIALAASLPPLDPVQAILPTWYHPEMSLNTGLRPLHLYVGYAALLAGGFTWLAYQSDLREPPKPSAAPSIAPPAQVPATNRAQSAVLAASVSSPEQASTSASWAIATG